MRGDREIPLGRNYNEERSATVMPVLHPGAPVLLAVVVGSGNRGLYVAVTAIGMDKSSIGQLPLSKTAVCSPSERNF